MSILLVILVTLIAGATAYSWVLSSTRSEASLATLNAALKIEGVQKLPSGGLKVYVRAIRAPLLVDYLYIFDMKTGELLHAQECEVDLRAGELGYITVPALKLSRIAPVEGGRRVRVRVIAHSGLSTGSTVSAEIIEVVTYKPTYIGLKAYRYSYDESHWLIFDYNTGKYRFFDNTSNTIQGPYTGVAPILEGMDEYTITESWVSWNQRPVDSPIVIVVNPKNAEEDWVFTWHDPHGTWRFYLQRLEGEVEVDFLIFWEDLFNPYHPVAVDDWRDHVVRVTVFTDGRYRITVYMAKGGYSHEFYLDVYDSLSPAKLVYVKPFHAYWWNYDGTFYREMSDKVYWR